MKIAHETTYCKNMKMENLRLAPVKAVRVDVRERGMQARAFAGRRSRACRGRLSPRLDSASGQANRRGFDLDLGSWMLDVESFGSLREFWYGCHR